MIQAGRPVNRGRSLDPHYNQQTIIPAYVIGIFLADANRYDNIWTHIFQNI